MKNVFQRILPGEKVELPCKDGSVVVKDALNVNFMRNANVINPNAKSAKGTIVGYYYSNEKSGFVPRFKVENHDTGRLSDWNETSVIFVHPTKIVNKRK